MRCRERESVGARRPAGSPGCRGSVGLKPRLCAGERLLPPELSAHAHTRRGSTDFACTEQGVGSEKVGEGSRQSRGSTNHPQHQSQYEPSPQLATLLPTVHGGAGRAVERFRERLVIRQRADHCRQQGARSVPPATLERERDSPRNRVGECGSTRMRRTSSAGVVARAHACAYAMKNSCSRVYPSRPGRSQFFGSALPPRRAPGAASTVTFRRACHASYASAMPPASAPSSPPVYRLLIGYSRPSGPVTV